MQTAGTVLCVGDDSYGALGNNSTTDQRTWVAPSGLTNGRTISANANYACALRAMGVVSCWGHIDTTTGPTPPSPVGYVP